MPHFENTFTIADILNFILLLITAIGVILAYRQIKEGRKTQSATFFKELYSTMFSDTEIGNAYYKIEYNEFNYDKSFHGSEEEKIIDRLLGFVDLLCYLHAQRVITDKEMMFFRYRLFRIYKNPNIQRYFEFLRLFFDAVGSQARPFNSFFSYCEREQGVKVQ
jgi:hypothetical protein